MDMGPEYSAVVMEQQLPAGLDDPSEAFLKKCEDNMIAEFDNWKKEKPKNNRSRSGRDHDLFMEIFFFGACVA